MVACLHMTQLKSGNSEALLVLKLTCFKAFIYELEKNWGQLPLPNKLQ